MSAEQEAKPMVRRSTTLPGDLDQEIQRLAREDDRTISNEMCVLLDVALHGDYPELSAYEREGYLTAARSKQLARAAERAKQQANIIPFPQYGTLVRDATTQPHQLRQPRGLE